MALARREVNMDNLRMLVHCTILVANESGQPVGQPLQQVNGQVEVNEGLVAKRPRLDQANETSLTDRRLRVNEV